MDVVGVGRTRLVLLVGVVAMLAAGPGASGAASLHVLVEDRGYRDAATATPVTAARVGDVVTFELVSGFHTVTSGALGGALFVEGGPDSPLLTRQGDTYSYEATAAGAWPYTCQFHPDMQGIIIAEP